MDRPTTITAEQREALRQAARAARARASETIARSAALLEVAATVHDAAELRVALSMELCRELRGRVGEYVVLLRSLETPPERVVVDAKGIVADAVPSRDRRAQVVTSLIVDWAIETYYAA